MKNQLLKATVPCGELNDDDTNGFIDASKKRGKKEKKMREERKRR